MEANFFRFLAAELASALSGQRMEKVHGPAEDVLVFTLHGQGRTSHLIFRPAKTAGLLFFSAERPVNPFTAPVRVMWLRKRLCGRRLLEARVDWPGLRLGFLLSPRDLPGCGQWLVFDLRAGLTLEEVFPAVPDPAWPDLAHVLDQAEVWREHPQITPPLRKHLAALGAQNPALATQLLERLARGEAEAFFLPPAPQPPLVWQPLAKSEGQTEDQPGAERFSSASEAATAFGQRTLFPQLARAEDAEAVDQAAKARKRLARQLALLDQDEARHGKLAELAVAAEALQIALSGLRTTPQQPSITLEHPEHGPVEVPLDPRLTPVGNMAHLFKQAAKGRRGLAHARRRRAELAEGASLELPPSAKSEKNPARRPAPVVLPKRYQGLAVATFRTSDGFLVLRGKSSQANHDMLSRAAGPFDLWFHAAGGPSAHVILKRDFPDQDVPLASLLEAAGLCALKSYRKNDAKAEVLLAKVRDVRKVKGAAIGSVAVDQVERTLLVALDPTLEERLAVQPGA